MTSTLLYYWRLSRLEADQRKIERAYRAERLSAKKDRNSAESLERIEHAEWSERQLVDDQIARLKTQRLWPLAFRYDIPVSGHDDWWEESQTMGGRHLTPKGLSELRSAIRKERNERWSYWDLRIKVIVALATAITGVTGALIGLAAILKD